EGPDAEPDAAHLDVGEGDQQQAAGWDVAALEVLLDAVVQLLPVGRVTLELVGPAEDEIGEALLGELAARLQAVLRARLVAHHQRDEGVDVEAGMAARPFGGGPPVAGAHRGDALGFAQLMAAVVAVSRARRMALVDLQVLDRVHERLAAGRAQAMPVTAIAA